MQTTNTEPAKSASALDMNEYTLHRRFDRMGRLVGNEAMAKLFNSHVMVIGVGGVGSFAAESLARSGIGHLTLVDFDEVCITNTNRQLHALQGVIGQKKAKIMAERLKKINPQAQIDSIERFYSAETANEILALCPDVIIDAIDNITAKCHLLNECKSRDLKVISSTGAGSRLDPLAIKVCDLAETHSDPLAHSVRKILRSKYDFPNEGPMGIKAIFSTEVHREPEELTYDKGQGFKCVCPQGQNNFHSCDKRNVIHGTASFVVGTFGLVAASETIKILLA